MAPTSSPPTPSRTACARCTCPSPNAATPRPSLSSISLKRTSPNFRKILPDDIKVSYVFDQSPVVKRSINDVLKEGGLGALLTGLMVLLFLRDWRSAFIVVINIPLSLLGACSHCGSGESIHLMTLGGLALAIGILVDESTVAVENIHAHIARGSSVSRAALEGTRETALPRLLAMLVYPGRIHPRVFHGWRGQGAFRTDGLAVGFAMIASYLLSSTLVPILSVWFLRGHSSEIHEASYFAKMQRAYAAVFWAASSRSAGPSRSSTWLVCGGIVWVFGARLGTEIFPKTDNGQFALRLRAPSGTRVDLTEALAKRVLDTIAREAGGADKIEVTIGMVGVHNSSFPVNLVHLWNGGPEEGWLAVQLKPKTGIASRNSRRSFAPCLHASCPMFVSRLSRRTSFRAS
jgi:multidrug efflux pump subunit AcrB